MTVTDKLTHTLRTVKGMLLYGRQVTIFTCSNYLFQLVTLLDGLFERGLSLLKLGLEHLDHVVLSRVWRHVGANASRIDVLACLLDRKRKNYEPCLWR